MHKSSIYKTDWIQIPNMVMYLMIVLIPLLVLSGRLNVEPTQANQYVGRKKVVGVLVQLLHLRLLKNCVV
jgi:hypothetical protein